MFLELWCTGVTTGLLARPNISVACCICRLKYGSSIALSSIHDDASHGFRHEKRPREYRHGEADPECEHADVVQVHVSMILS